MIESYCPYKNKIPKDLNCQTLDVSNVDFGTKYNKNGVKMDSKRMLGYLGSFWNIAIYKQSWAILGPSMAILGPAKTYSGAIGPS